METYIHVIPVIFNSIVSFIIIWCIIRYFNKKKRLFRQYYENELTNLKKRISSLEENEPSKIGKEDK
ncbi:MAG: hypothetical protein E7299_03470 [Lachnospiraceae bacterium]|nr:hypothetical protein [Lachnospiraceae bacterium]